MTFFILFFDNILNKIKIKIEMFFRLKGSQTVREQNDLCHNAGGWLFGALSRRRDLLALVYGVGALLSESCCSPNVCKTERRSNAFRKRVSVSLSEQN